MLELNGPVISTWSSLSRHSMARSPPGSETVTFRPVRESRAAATAAAHAAEPQASVSPAPRSQVRITTRCRAACGDRNVGPLGKELVVFEFRWIRHRSVGVWIVDPENRVRVAHAQGRRRAQERGAGRSELQIDRARVRHQLCRRSSSQRKRGAPMSTVNSPSAARQQAIAPADVRNSVAPCRSRR